MPESSAIRMDGIRSVAQISQRLVEQLVTEIPPARIMDGIKAMLDATFVAKSGKSHPDYRAREAGIKLYMSYVVGLPLQRQVVANINSPQSDEDEWSRFKQSPAAMSALRQKLEQLETEIAQENGSTGGLTVRKLR